MAKSKGESLGIMVMEAGYGSVIPACVVAHLSKTGAALKSGLLNVGDHIITINGVSLVGMPTKLCVEQIKVKINAMHCVPSQCMCLYTGAWYNLRQNDYRYCCIAGICTWRKFCQFWFL